MLRKYITNNIRRYTHTHSPSNKKIDTIVEDKKLDKIMPKLNEIVINLKYIYFVSVITGIILLFK